MSADGFEHTAYLGLGSNVGDRLANLCDAVERIGRSPRVHVVRMSSVYETEPVGELTEQRDFYNAVVAIETDLDPQALLQACKRIERELGREEGGPRHGPRPIDIDLLTHGTQVREGDRLTLPHPELTLRRFVLVPLLEIAPALAIPGLPPLELVLARLGEQERVAPVGPLERTGTRPDSSARA